MHTSSFADRLAMLESVTSPQIQVFSCPECQYAFTARDILQSHMEKFHNDICWQILKNGPIPSVACRQITTSAAKKKQGESEGRRSYNQRLTKTAPLQQDVVKTHRLTNKGKKMHVCMLCNSSFSRVGTQKYKELNILNRNQHLHAEERRVNLGNRNKSLPSSNPKKLQKTGGGGKASRSKRRVKKRRVRTGDQERPFICKHCEKCFSQLGNLKIHQRVHTGDQPFQCKLCSKRFSQMGNLKAHLRLHDGNKPFTCKQCDKTFSQRGNLHTHERLHTGIKPYACKSCAKSFNQLGQLLRHRIVHLSGPEKAKQLKRIKGVKGTKTLRKVAV